MRWKKIISLYTARELCKIFSEYFNIPNCNVFFVDKFLKENKYGLYFAHPEFSTILVFKYSENRIGTLMHELTHHLEFNYYGFNDEDSEHGYNYQLAKRRVKNWCKKYISSKPNWNKPLGALQYDKDMEEFEL